MRPTPPLIVLPSRSYLVPARESYLVPAREGSVVPAQEGYLLISLGAAATASGAGAYLKEFVKKGQAGKAPKP